MQKGVGLLTFIMIIGVIIIAIMEGFAIIAKYNGIEMTNYKRTNIEVTKTSTTTPWHLTIKEVAQEKINKLVDMFRKEERTIEWAFEQTNCPSGSWQTISENKDIRECTTTFIYDKHEERFQGPILKDEKWQIYLFDICEDELRQHARGYCTL